MCGRFLLFTSGADLAEWLDLPEVPALQPRYNIAPTQPVAAVRAGPGGEVVESCAILTTEANDLVRPVHDRMPVILGPDGFGPWLDPAVRDPAALAPWLRPYPAEAMTACPVGAWVSNPRNEGPACLAPPA
jgi:putative SOS response-associated peptidase YedK